MKFSFLLLLTCIQVIAQDNYQTYKSGSFTGLKDASGKIILSATYDNLGWSDGTTQPFRETIGATQNDKWGLINLNGKQLFPANYNKLEPLFSGKYKVAVKGKLTNRYYYGVVNEKGEVELNLDYFKLEKENDVVFVTTFNEGQFLKGALDSNLKWLTHVRYKDISQKEEVLIAEWPNGLFDVYDLDGNVLDSALDELIEKRSHLITNKRGKYGKIAWDGSEIVHPENKEITLQGDATPFPTWQVDPGGEGFSIQCDSLQRWNLEWLAFTNGFFQLVASDGKPVSQSFKYVQKGKHNIIARANGNSKWYALDVAGKVVLQTNDSILIAGNYLIAKEKKLWAIYDRLGQKVVEKSFEAVEVKSGQFIAVKKHNYWAILDGINKTISPFRYDEIGDIRGSNSVVKYIHRWGVHHAKHDWILEPDFDEIRTWKDKFIARKKDGHYLFDASGFLKFQTIDKIIPSKDGLILFDGGRFSIIGSRGTPIANTEYGSVTRWGNFYELEGSFNELIHENGRKILSPADEIQDISGYSEEMFLIKKNDNYGFVDTDGKLRIANRYDSAQVFSEGFAAIKLRGKWGFIDMAERLVIQPHYEAVTTFKNGLTTYKLSGNFGFLNLSGQEITNPIYRSIIRTEYGNYIIQGANGRFGFSDENGIISISPSYEEIHDLGKNRLWTKRDGKIGLLDYSGRQVLGFEFDGIQIIQNHLLLKKD